MTATTNAIHGVIFDMDGVLCDSEPFICEAACRMFAERYVHTMQPEDFVPFVGAGENRYLGGPAEKYGIHLDLESDKARTYAIYLEIIRGRLDPLPGARQFVADCRRRGVKLAVATSADRIKMDGNLAQIGIAPESFDYCVTGTDVVNKKPHPEIFLNAAKNLGLEPRQCLVVEDAPNGVRAGKSAGSRVLGLTSSFDEATLRDHGADWIAPDLARVPAEVYESFARPGGA